MTACCFKLKFDKDYRSFHPNSPNMITLISTIITTIYRLIVLLHKQVLVFHDEGDYMLAEEKSPPLILPRVLRPLLCITHQPTLTVSQVKCKSCCACPQALYSKSLSILQSNSVLNTLDYATLCFLHFFAAH